MFANNLWMNLLASRYIMPLIVFSFQHYDEHKFQTVIIPMYKLYVRFLSNKTRFIYMSTVTRSHSCSQKKLRVRLAYILLFYY